MYDVQFRIAGLLSHILIMCTGFIIAVIINNSYYKVLYYSSLSCQPRTAKIARLSRTILFSLFCYVVLDFMWGFWTPVRRLGNKLADVLANAFDRMNLFEQGDPVNKYGPTNFSGTVTLEQIQWASVGITIIQSVICLLLTYVATEYLTSKRPAWHMCSTCHYSLLGATSVQCTECGALIPKMQREEIEIFRERAMNDASGAKSEIIRNSGTSGTVE